MIRTSLAAFTERLAASVRDRGTLPPLTPSRIRIELLAGLTVALALVTLWGTALSPHAQPMLSPLHFKIIVIFF